MRLRSASLQPAFSAARTLRSMTMHFKIRPSGTRGRLLRLVVLGGLLSALAVPGLPAPVRADEPVRSGTIVSGTGSSPANFWVRGMEGCVGAPACSAWLQSGCEPALAGADPALHASIVDVADLAGTEREFDVRGGVGINWGRVVLQFWTDGSENPMAALWCEELFATASRWECAYGCTLPLPAGAKFMTISSGPDNTNIHWTLT